MQYSLLEATVTRNGHKVTEIKPTTWRIGTERFCNGQVVLLVLGVGHAVYALCEVLAGHRILMQ